MKKGTQLHSRKIFLEWYGVSSFGQILQSIEASYLKSALKLTYNQKTLQVGHTGSEGLYIDADFLPDFAVIDSAPLKSGVHGHTIASSLDDWPIGTESIDNLIIPHVIEFENNRHQVLQEAERVLKPEGSLFLLCLNPLSIHGIVQYLPHTSSYWRTDFVTSRRLLDWLSLLKFDAEYSAALGITSTNSILKPNTFWERTRAELSFAYAIRAIKRRYRLVPLDPAWIPIPSLAAGSMFEQNKLNHLQ